MAVETFLWLCLCVYEASLATEVGGALWVTEPAEKSVGRKMRKAVQTESRASLLSRRS